jgi:hypothetical protein
LRAGAADFFATAALGAAFFGAGLPAFFLGAAFARDGIVFLQPAKKKTVAKLSPRRTESKRKPREPMVFIQAFRFVHGVFPIKDFPYFRNPLEISLNYLI